MLLADGEEPVVAVVPVAADPVQAEVPAMATAPQTRDVAVTVHERLGAESDDGVLPLLVGVLLGEAEELLVERGAEDAAVHLGEHLVGRRVAVHVDVLERNLAVLRGDTLAALDRIEPLALAVGVDVGREPALQLLERGLDVDDRSRERRVAVRRPAPVRVAALGLRLLGEPVRVGDLDDLHDRGVTALRPEAVDRLERNHLLPCDVHEGRDEPQEIAGPLLDTRNVFLRHDTPLRFGSPLIPTPRQDPRLAVFVRKLSRYLDIFKVQKLSLNKIR